MDYARCTEDNTIYTAIEFSKQHLHDLTRKRYLLVCPQCEGRAFFRTASKDGRAPCFGSRYHHNGCGLASVEHASIEGGYAQNRDILNNSGDRIFITLNPKEKGNSCRIEASENALNSRRARAYVGEETKTNTHMQRSLRSLLKTLIAAPAFGHSDQILRIEEHDDFLARDFFVAHRDASENHEGLFKGYWGALSYAQVGYGATLWLNSGGWDNISYGLTPSVTEEVFRRYKIETYDDLAGAHVLVLGAPHISGSGKLCCILEKPEYIAIHMT